MSAGALVLLRRRFDAWRLQLHEGFNLLLYGYGSKRGVVEEFLHSVWCAALAAVLGWGCACVTYACLVCVTRSSAVDPSCAVIVANGANSGCSVRQIADLVCRRVVASTAKFPSLAEQCRFISLQMGAPESYSKAAAGVGGGSGGGSSSAGPRLLLAIHNIDGPSFRSTEAQQLLR